jgi:hypothetical protein
LNEFLQAVEKCKVDIKVLPWYLEHSKHDSSTKIQFKPNKKHQVWIFSYLSLIAKKILDNNYIAMV